MRQNLTALKAFDTAARCGSFRAAAEELSVTPTAISHHIRGLEEQLGTNLFLRSNRKVTLTTEGKRLARATSEAFGILDDAIDTFRRFSDKVVRIAAGPIITARWIMPKMGDFWQRYPDYTLEVLPANRPQDFERNSIDIVIKWERLCDIPHSAIQLLELQPVAVASPKFIRDYGPFSKPADLLDAPIMHQRNHWGWHDWFSAHDLQLNQKLNGPIFDDAHILLRGANEGQGAIVGWLPLINQDLKQGRIVRLFNEDIEPTHGYYIEIPNANRNSRAINTVVEWLSS